MKRYSYLISITLLLLSISFLSQANEYNPVESEENNTSATANSIATDGEITGNINNTDDFYDYFKFTLPYDGQIAFVVIPSGTLDAYLDLFDWNGESFLWGSYQIGMGVNDTLTFANLKAGTYYIRIGGGGYGSYTLTNVFTPTAIPEGNDAEPNDAVNQAMLINPDNFVTGHLNFYGDGSIDFYDYFSITIPYDGQLSFIIFPELTLDAYLDLFDWNGESFLRSSYQTGIGVSDTLIYENLKAGTYYIRVGGGGYGSYMLINGFTPTAIPYGNDAEPNDVVEQAVVINPDNTISGHLNFYGNGTADYLDYFSITIPVDGQLSFIIFPELTLDPSLYLYDWDGSNYITGSYQPGFGVNDTLTFRNLKAGTYYIIIGGGGGYGSYLLTNGFTPTALPNGNDSEPNDSYGQAITINLNEPKTGHINYFGNGSLDYYDWYTFTISEKSNGILTILPEQNLDPYIEMFNSDTQFLMTSIYGGEGISDTLFVIGLNSGTYLVKIGGEGYGSYTFNVSLIQDLASPNQKIMPMTIFSDHNGRIILNNIDITENPILEIYNLSGKLILKKKLVNSDCSYTLSEKQGVYFAKVYSGNSSVIQKVILK